MVFALVLTVAPLAMVDHCVTCRYGDCRPATLPAYYFCEDLGSTCRLSRACGGPHPFTEEPFAMPLLLILMMLAAEPSPVTGTMVALQTNIHDGQEHVRLTTGPDGRFDFVGIKHGAHTREQDRREVRQPQRPVDESVDESSQDAATLCMPAALLATTSSCQLKNGSSAGVSATSRQTSRQSERNAR